MKLHAITGLPRSGSTLLCNVLAQNPRFRVSSTSPLPGLLLAMRANLSVSIEVRSELAHDRIGTETRLRDTLAAAARAWYGSDLLVFDKARAWSNALDLLAEVSPDGQAILCVRDLRAVFGSVEKQHRKFPVLDESQGPQGWTTAGRADKAFDTLGIIGAPVIGLIDAANRNAPNAIVWRYEDFMDDPDKQLRALYRTLNEPWFAHDLQNVVNRATDLDALYLNKFPHDGSGPVVDRQPDGWRRFVPPNIERMILERFAGFYSAFGYSIKEAPNAIVRKEPVDHSRDRRGDPSLLVGDVTADVA